MILFSLSTLPSPFSSTPAHIPLIFDCFLKPGPSAPVDRALCKGNEFLLFPFFHNFMANWILSAKQNFAFLLTGRHFSRVLYDFRFMKIIFCMALKFNVIILFL